jgi:hypothetical protein
MIALRRGILFGFLIWGIAFVVAFAVFPIRESSRPLFESIMPVVLAGATVFFTHRYFRRVRADFAREGLLLGLLWFGVNVAIDLPLMLAPSPMQMSLSEYVADIGLTYALIPIITVGMGIARAQGGSDPPGRVGSSDQV